MTPEEHYECSLEQADGNFDLEHNTNLGDDGDLFDAGGAFGPDTVPDSIWWDGTPSGLAITDISPAGPTMTFRTGS